MEEQLLQQVPEIKATDLSLKREIHSQKIQLTEVLEPEIKAENLLLKLEEMNQSERGNRADDFRSESSMEDRKKEGYF